MDPNACLQLIEEALKDGKNPYQNRVDLLEWLDKGGFEPDWIKFPLAFAFCAGRGRVPQNVRAFHPKRFGVVNSGVLVGGSAKEGLRIDFGSLLGGKFWVPFKDLVMVDR